MRFRAVKALVVGVDSCTAGCASTLSRIDISDGTIPDKPRWKVPVYPGIQLVARGLPGSFAPYGPFRQLSAETLLFAWLDTGDVPVSLAADTLLLPFDSYDRATLDQRRAAQQGERKRRQESGPQPVEPQSR